MRRLSNGVLLVALALVAGCYSPKLKNRGFACDGNYVGACPTGFACINGICDDGSGGPPPPVEDMAMGGTDGSGGGDMASAPDMAQSSSSPDFSMPPPPPDFSMPPPPDMACKPSGASCVHSAECCSFCFAGNCF